MAKFLLQRRVQVSIALSIGGEMVAAIKNSGISHFEFETGADKKQRNTSIR